MKLHEAAKSTLVLLLLLLGTSISGWCEQDPLRLGQVTDDELKMGIYPQDTAAAAVVLYDYGHSSFLFSKGTQLQFKRTVRVKILKKAGLDFANIEIPYFKKSPESKEEVLNLKGFSYNLENGKMVKVKLEENAVFDEKVDANWFVRKLAMPGVKVGSVIEYTYTIKSDFLHNLREWEFQSSIPVRWSEYRVAMVPFYEYKQVLHGFYPFHVQDSKENRVTAPITWDKEVGYAKMEERGTLSMSVVEYRWVMKDVPAFKEEPYLPNARDYLSKVEFELSKIQYPDQEPRFMAGDWEGFTKELLKEEEFGGQLTSVPALQKVAATVVAGKTEDLARAKAIVEYVQTSMRWDGKYRIYAENLKKAHDKHTGSSAEINLLLVNLLRDAGLIAQPMLVSTRGHGQPLESSPMLSKFNYVIACVNLAGKDYLLDATEPGLAFGMLPLRCLNGKGWVVQPPKGKWLPLQGVDRNSQMVSAQLTLKPTGEVLGSMEESYLGVPALQMRSKIKEKGQDTYVKSYANAGADWVRQDVKLINLEKPEETFKTQYQLSRAGAPQPEELLYLSPMLLHGQQENPFKLASRQYPVDFGSPVDETYVMNYELPPGYVIEELPKATVFSLPGNAAKFSYVVQEVNGKLQVMSKLTIHKTVFTASDYQNLREFYARMVAKHAEKVVLRKKS